MTASVNRLSTIPFNSPGDNPVNVSGYISARALGAGVAESITIPAGAAYVRIAATADLYYSFAAAATVPVDTDDGSACELLKVNGNAEYRYIPPGSTALSVISVGASIVTASFYSN